MTWAAIERGRRLTAASLVAATRDAARVSYALALCFEQFDAIITPMLAMRHRSSGHCRQTATTSTGISRVCRRSPPTLR
jgi:hypothetical protein